METRTSKAQPEVWEWKEKLSAELLKTPVKDRANYIKEKAKNARKEIGAFKAHA